MFLMEQCFTQFLVREVHDLRKFAFYSDAKKHVQRYFDAIDKETNDIWINCVSFVLANIKIHGYCLESEIMKKFGIVSLKDL